jgi:uroporphyrinogen decarboxylase
MDKKQLLEYTIHRSAEELPLFHPILMQFAAHEIGRSYRDYYLDHRVLADSWIACMKRYGAETAMLISDPGREAEAFGGVFVHPEETVPHCREYPVVSMEDVEALAPLDLPALLAAERTRDRIDGARLLRSMLGTKGNPASLLIGWVEGPLAEACDLAGVSEMLMKLMLEPEFIGRLMRTCLETGKVFAAAQAEAGCDIIGVGDAICSQISADTYREHVWELHKELFASIHESGALVKLHICGNISHLLPLLRESGADIIDLDWQVDMDIAWQKLGPEIIRSGNLDPAAVLERLTPVEIESRTRQLVSGEKGRAFILSGGCEITPLTPAENLLAMKLPAK